MSKSLKLFSGAIIGTGVVFLLAVNFADRNITQMPANAPRLTALPAPIPEPAAPVAQAAGDAAPEVAADNAVAEVAEPVAAGGLVAAAQADEGGTGTRFGLGRAALPEEIAAWDVDIRPDGTGLPEGSGNALDGEPLFEDNCAACHGSFAEGVGNWPKLAGGDGTLADEDPLKTVGSYWPYLSTVWDYVHRSMPFGSAQTLSDDDVYAIVAYILYSNDLIDDDFDLSPETWAEVEMPNADGFIIDDRAETEYAQWRSEPCMSDCKDSVEITMRATVLDVTPDEGGDEEQASGEMSGSDVQVASADEEAPAVEDTGVEATAEEAAAEIAAVDPELAAAGEKVFRKCKACHQIGDGAKNRTGPHLTDIVGREIGGVDGFRYSGTMADMGGVWDRETLAAFLADPRGTVKGTKMAFAGLKSEEDIDAVLAYLQAASE